MASYTKHTRSNVAESSVNQPGSSTEVLRSYKDDRIDSLLECCGCAGPSDPKCDIHEHRLDERAAPIVGLEPDPVRTHFDLVGIGRQFDSPVFAQDTSITAPPVPEQPRVGPPTRSGGSGKLGQLPPRPRNSLASIGVPNKRDALAVYFRWLRERRFQAGAVIVRDSIAGTSSSADSRPLVAPTPRSVHAAFSALHASQDSDEYASFQEAFLAHWNSVVVELRLNK
jgi:hypothetical protein